MYCRASKTELPDQVQVRFPIYVGGRMELSEITVEAWLPGQYAKAFINAPALLSLK